MKKWPIGRHSKTRFFQNWILRNTLHHQPLDIYEVVELCKTLIAELRKTWVAQKRNRVILRKMTFANDCANCCFFAQNWCTKKEKFCISFRKNCAIVLRMVTLCMWYHPITNIGGLFSMWASWEVELKFQKNLIPPPAWSVKEEEKPSLI